MVGNNDLCIKYIINADQIQSSNSQYCLTRNIYVKKKNHFFPTSTSMAVQVNNFQWELIFHCLLQTTKKL